MRYSYTVLPKVRFNLIFFIEKGALIERETNLALTMLDLKGL